MGYVLFTARKLNLTTRLNNYNYQLLMGAQRRQNMVERESQVQTLADMNKSMRQMQMYQKQQAIYDKLLAKNADGTSSTKVDEDTYNATMKDLERELEGMKMQMESEQKTYEAEMNALKTVENAMDLEQKRLETLVQGITKELETAEKAETSGIERATPKYGGASN